MLRVSKLADYATVIMHFLAAHSGPLASANEIAQGISLSTPTVSKILKILGEAGLVVSARGVGGGYRLAKPAQAISVAEMVAAVDGKPALTECANPESLCTQEGICAIKHNWRMINHFVLNTLQNVSLADMSQPFALPRLSQSTLKNQVAVER